MRLVRFKLGNKESYGIKSDENLLLDLPALARQMEQPLPSSLNNLVLLGNKGLVRVEHLIKVAKDRATAKATARLKDVKLLAPIDSPPKIVCLGLNYRDHIAEQNAPLPDDLIVFIKPRTAVLDPDGFIIKPEFVKKLDYEAELAIIIGRRGKNIPSQRTNAHILGYTCFNDVSARDIQFKDKQWTRGKSFDTFAPIGPCITTFDQIGDPNNLLIRTRVNGELRQNSSTCNMVFNVYQIVHRLSQVMTLEPGDVIATGTPAGVGFAMKPEPKFLEPNDVVEVEIENIGILKNTVTTISRAT